MRPWRRRKETLGVFSLYAKRYKSEYISVNNNTNLNLFKILSNYIIWNRLSQKTISRYCPFKPLLRTLDSSKTKFLNFSFFFGGGGGKAKFYLPGSGFSIGICWPNWDPDSEHCLLETSLLEVADTAVPTRVQINQYGTVMPEILLLYLLWPQKLRKSDKTLFIPTSIR